MSTETVGDNREFNVTDASDVEVNFIGGDGTKTSADDTATVKYTDIYGTVKDFFLRVDKTVQIVSMTGVVFTDPITVIINKSHREQFRNGLITKMLLRVQTGNTNIKIRVIQRE